MVTNYPHSVAHDEPVSDPRAMHQDDGVSVVGRVRQILCGLHGHDNLLQFERDRMFLRCVSCGHETPGWELTETPPTVTVREDVRPAMVRAHLVSARRIA